MYNHQEYTANYPDSFKLNLRILSDSLSDRFSDIRIKAGSDPQCLCGIRIFQMGKALFSKYIYLIPASQISRAICYYDHANFLIAGTADLSEFSDSAHILCVGEESDFPEILNLVQQTFEKYLNWDKQLQNALQSSDPIDEMLEASLPIFNNPIFAHDTNFYILSCPRQVRGMSIWERDPRTGRLTVPLSLIQDFRLDMEYLRTLTTKGPNIYSEDMRGYRILYFNLWLDKNYMGRLCVNELQSLILPSHFLAINHLGTFIELCLHQHMLFRLNMGNDIRQFFTDYLDGKVFEESQLQHSLHFLNWNMHDRYLCLRLESDHQNEQMHSSMATLGHIEAQIPDGCAFIYHQGIAVVVNLSYDDSSTSDILSALAIILREGLYKLGASNVIQDFLQLPQAYSQAAAALELGKKSGSMIWCYRFDDYILDYMLEQSTTQISPELLCHQSLSILKKYDEENNTELLHTLNVYLSLERNALQTANALFIHRSTLFYRLERIQKLTRLNLDDAKVRLVLLLSFAMLKK